LLLQAKVILPEELKLQQAEADTGIATVQVEEELKLYKYLCKMPSSASIRRTIVPLSLDGIAHPLLSQRCFATIPYSPSGVL
jgi:hypothetical protein